MAVELEQLRREASALAEKFRQAGQDDLADILDNDARGLGVISKIAGGRGFKTFTPPESETLPSRLEPIPFVIEIPQVSEAVYAETRKAVEATGAFIAPIRSVTLEELLAEDIEREARGGSRRFNHRWVNTSPDMRATLPPAMEVFIHPETFKIKGSDYLLTDTQKRMIQDEGARSRERLLEKVRQNVIFEMMDPSSVSQLEDAWIDAGNGLLLPDYFARTDVKTVRGHVAAVGRGGLGNQRKVDGWGRGVGGRFVFGVLVGVLPQKLAA